MTYTVELTTWPGLLPALGDELVMRQLGYTIIDQSVQLVMRNPWNLAPRIYCAQAAFLCLSFAVPRPKALLGQQYWDQIVALAQQITAEHPFATLELAAAGAESAVMKRIATTLAERLKLRVVPSEGDLQVRVRPSPTGWDVLLRLTPAIGHAGMASKQLPWRIKCRRCCQHGASSWCLCRRYNIEFGVRLGDVVDRALAPRGRPTSVGLRYQFGSARLCPR